MINIYSVSSFNFRPFSNLGKEIQVLKVEDLKKPENSNDISIVILHGGEDISPALYNQKPISETRATNTPSNRDKLEIEIINKAVELGIPLFGICRGAQLLCAAAGGTLIQHVDGHGFGQHRVTTYSGRTLNTNSLHHQMMNPFNLNKDDWELLAWTTNKTTNKYLDDTGELDIPEEPEVVYFPKIKGFSVQGHPEFLTETDDFASWCRSEFFKRIL